MYPAVGRAVLWNNYDDGKREQRTQHGGEKVTCPNVEKICLNAWFHGQKPQQTLVKRRTLRLKTKHEVMKTRQVKK